MLLASETRNQFLGDCPGKITLVRLPWGGYPASIMIRFWGGSILGYRHLGLLALLFLARIALINVAIALNINFDIRHDLGVRDGGNALANGHFKW